MNIPINNEKKHFCFSLFQKNEIYKNIIIIFYIFLCPILMIFSFIFYLFNILKLICSNLLLKCNDFENDLENQY